MCHTFASCADLVDEVPPTYQLRISLQSLHKPAKLSPLVSCMWATQYI